MLYVYDFYGTKKDTLLIMCQLIFFMQLILMGIEAVSLDLEPLFYSGMNHRTSS